MTTSQTAFLSEILGTETIPPSKLAYFRRRLSNHIYATVLNEFLRLEKAGLISRAKLAKRIGRRPEQITRWLGSSGNWTIETLSDLLVAMKCEPSISISSLTNAQIGESHASMPVKRSTDQTAGRSEAIPGTVGIGENVEGAFRAIMIPMQHTQTARSVSYAR